MLRCTIKCVVSLTKTASITRFSCATLAADRSKQCLHQQHRHKSGNSGDNKPTDIQLKLDEQRTKRETTSASATTTGGSQQKQLEINTSKGILSVSMTIEDSKINEVVIQKAKDLSAQTTVLSEQQVTNSEKNVSKGKGENKKKPLSSLLKLKKSTQSKDEAKTSQIGTINRTEAPAAEEVPSKPAQLDINHLSVERNFITPVRAMSDFMLKPSDLESLPSIKRRSPYEHEPPITVYRRRDVETKAMEVWGSRENFIKEFVKSEVQRKQYQQNVFSVKRRLRDYRREIGSRFQVTEEERGLKSKSAKVVLIAIAINGANFVIKLGAYFHTGSHSMFAESIHSLADLVNQVILAYGIHKSIQEADSEHPYGYTNMKYVVSLISGVGIFCVGCTLSIYHGIAGIIHPEVVQDYFSAYCVLLGSLISEGFTLITAIRELKSAAKKKNMKFSEYVISGIDPCVNVVFAEDAAAVSGVLLAAACMGLSFYTGSPIFDAMGSIMIGCLLGGVASSIIYTNMNALVGRSIAAQHLNKLNSMLENDIMIRGVHDVKGIDIGNSLVRYKAEVDFDGRELTRCYLEKQNIAELLKLVRSFQTPIELENFLLDHGENIVDMMGGEIDRIEMKLRSQFPEVRHCDLEIL